MTRRSVLLAFAITPSLWGWGNQGHELIGRLTQERLKGTKALAVIESWFGGVVAMDKLSTCADNLRSAQRNFAALRPDCVVSKPELDAMPPTDNWHHVDIPFPLPSKDRSKIYAEATAEDAPRAPAQIEFFRKRLADNKLSPHERAIALMFLIHFVEDLHQPLHATARNHDKGGNDVSVRLLPGTMRLNLHGVWDVEILQRTPDLETRVRAAMSPDMGKKRDPKDWAWESFAACEAAVYAGVRVPASRDDIVDLGPEYVTRAQPVAVQRLAQASVRLAEIIQRSVKK